ncbi:MAG: PTS system mannose/fructose/sorbose family transporter subunit IID [Erysipelotrichaceae bacterium]|nr:PTS system mannose/fructose/sorbose family transporter subunit IID [Erysipelotrichaceae bacterium]
MSETVKNANGEKNIRKAAWRLCATFQATENYEREGAYDFLYCILPFIAETYKDSPDELKYRLKKNNEFFNCNPVFSGPIIGLIAAMEENHVNEDTIQAIKVGLMGPLAGLGDTIIYTLIIPLLFSAGASLALKGSMAGPIIVIPITFVLMFVCRYYGTIYTYHRGQKGMDKIMASIDKITELASKYGCFIIGSIIVSMLSITTPVTFTINDNTVALQDKLNAVLPSLLTIVFVLLAYRLMTKRNLKPVQTLFVLIAIGFVLGVLGLL